MNRLRRMNNRLVILSGVSLVFGSFMTILSVPAVATAHTIIPPQGWGASAPAASQASGTIAGTVLDPLLTNTERAITPGLALPIRVRAFSQAGELIAQTTTSADGEYHLTLPTGTYLVSASLGGVTDSQEVSVPASTAVYTDFEVAANVIRGTVTDQNGQPVANAKVSIGNAPWGFSSTTTNSSGVYQIFGVPEGNYSLFAESPLSSNTANSQDPSNVSGKFAMAQMMLTVTANPYTRQDIGLDSPGGVMRGLVTSTDAATTDATNANTSTTTATTTTEATNANTSNQTGLLGLIRIANTMHQVVWEGFSNLDGSVQTDLPPGRYTVQTFVGKESHSQSIRIQPNQVTNVNFAVPMTAVMGQVLDHSNQPVLNAWVSVTDAYGNVVGKALTDIHGQYLINGLKQGSYRVRVSKGKFTGNPHPAYVFNDRVTTVNLTITGK